jgi:autophagy-related protein 2
MPWPSFIPWSNSLKTRACRQLIHHYLGVFFQEKLSLDQLSVDLFSGRGQVKDVILNLNVNFFRQKNVIFIYFLGFE